MNIDDLEKLYNDESFNRGGQELFNSLYHADDPGDVKALIVEAARVKDRLDQFHSLVSSDTKDWLRLIDSTTENDIVLIIDKLFQEVRGQENVFEKLLKEINRRQTAKDANKKEEQRPLLDDL